MIKSTGTRNISKKDVSETGCKIMSIGHFRANVTGEHHYRSGNAKNVVTMNVGAKFLLWIYKKIEVVKGVGQYTLNDVPMGTYSVKMNGTVLPGIQEVIIKITAFSELQLDQSGICVYTFFPNPELGGNLAVKCKEIVKTVEIKKQKE